jgi:hypothetical protein
MIRPGEFSFQARPGMNGNFLIPAYNDSSGGVARPGMNGHFRSRPRMIRPGEFSFQARPGMNGHFPIPAYHEPDVVAFPARV